VVGLIVVAWENVRSEGAREKIRERERGEREKEKERENMRMRY
jgi:hypothetical protein